MGEQRVIGSNHRSGGGGAPAADFTSQRIGEQEQVLAGLEQELERVTRDPRLSPAEKMERVARLNMKRELAFDIIAALMKAENENLKKIFQT